MSKKINLGDYKFGNLTGKSCPIGDECDGSLQKIEKSKWKCDKCDTKIKRDYGSTIITFDPMAMYCPQAH